MTEDMTVGRVFTTLYPEGKGSKEIGQGGGEGSQQPVLIQTANSVGDLFKMADNWRRLAGHPTYADLVEIIEWQYENGQAVYKMDGPQPKQIERIRDIIRVLGVKK
jgi:hypothetical protein